MIAAEEGKVAMGKIMKDHGGHEKNFGFYPKSSWNSLKGFKQISGMVRYVFWKIYANDLIMIGKNIRCMAKFQGIGIIMIGLRYSLK